MFFLLILLYSLLPKVIKLEVEIEKAILLKIYFKILIFYVKVFSYSFPSKNQNGKRKINRKDLRKKATKLNVKILVYNIFKIMKVFLEVSRTKLKSICVKLFCNDAAILAIASGIIYSIKGILLSCKQEVKVYYEGYLKNSGLSGGYLKVTLEVKIFPARILSRIFEIISIVRGVFKYGTSN